MAYKKIIISNHAGQRMHEREISYSNVLQVIAGGEIIEQYADNFPSKEKITMKCVTCKHGELKPGKATFMVEREGTIFVVKDVPALICGNCNESYFEGPIMDDLLQRAERAANTGVEVDIQKYAAA